MAQHIVIAAALFGASAVALTQASGQAIVVNNCSYDVSLNNVPAAGEGAEGYSTILSPGDKYSQYYTGLEGHHDGWSLKLAPVDGNGSIIQFEYTYQPTVNSDLWFDMSFVNGDPFHEDWQFDSNDASCQAQLTHAAYMFPTDDKFGMQKPCEASNDVTLTLCPNSGPGSIPIVSAISSAWSSVAAAATSELSSLVSAVAPTTSSTTFTTAPSSTPSTTPSAAPAVPTPVLGAAAPGNFGHGDGFNGPVEDSAVQGAAFADKAVVPHSYAHTVTEVTTAWVTSFTTVDFPAPTEEVHKRHAHHAGHHHA